MLPFVYYIGLLDSDSLLSIHLFVYIYINIHWSSKDINKRKDTMTIATSMFLSMKPSTTLLYKATNQVRFFGVASVVLKEAKAGTAQKKAAGVKRTKKAESAKELTKKELKKQERPKRPVSAYILYYRKNFDKFYSETKDVSKSAKAAGIAWKKETEAVKQEFVSEYNKEFEKYAKLRDEWINKYKKPLTGYNKFMKATFDTGVEGATAKDKLKTIAAKWSALTDAEKEIWSGKK